MPDDYYTQVTLEHDSALPEDRTVNTFSVSIVDADPAAELASWHSALNDFYQLVDQFLSASFSGAGTIKSYRRADPTPRVPALDTPITITPGTTSLAAEVALVMSFQAVRVAGEPQARRRGRIFLGPLFATANDSATARPSSTLVSSVANAGDGLITASKASTLWEWQVWSQVDGDGNEVDNGWVDNAFDTQRRRGLRATTRTTFS